MITREQAISLAHDFVAQSGYAVEFDVPQVRHMDAARINRLFGRQIYPCDSWIVEFPKILPEGVTESPGTVMVVLLEETGELREVYVAMPIEWARFP